MAPNLSGSCLSASQGLQGITWCSEWVPCGAKKRRRIHFHSSKQCLGSRGVAGQGALPPGWRRRALQVTALPGPGGHTQLPPPAHLWLRVPGLSLKGDAYQRSDEPKKVPECLLPRPFRMLDPRMDTGDFRGGSPAGVSLHSFLPQQLAFRDDRTPNLTTHQGSLEEEDGAVYLPTQRRCWSQCHVWKRRWTRAWRVPTRWPA
ncbi:uncharacterized protein LOC122681788 [Cervus elaphus]|uniref:uncharacterized protein LOC122681788 n=1 Tax=Cervus elaphus TaxID=9860 RepID=UPI001CC2A73F|nr:uncharacterized protein LOC122681788 [Cervus elaphus]